MEGKFKTGKKGRPKDVVILGKDDEKPKTVKIVSKHPLPENDKIEIVSRSGKR